MKRFLIMLTITTALFAGCFSNHCKDKNRVKYPIPDRTFSKEELTKYNGKNGKPAYIAFNGVVYDVSKAGAWKSGKHKGGRAGEDISSKLPGAIHGTNVICKLRPVGRLEQPPAKIGGDKKDNK